MIGSTASKEVLAVSTTTVTVQLPASDSLVPAAGQPHRIGPAYDALQRFAKGDIGREEFEQKKSVLKR
jgi:hypothetical protein